MKIMQSTRKNTDGSVEHLDAGPSIHQMASNLVSASLGIAASGFKLVSRAVYKDRLKTCRRCPLWIDDARFGYGKCSHIKCGCGKGKLRFAQQQCPDSPPRWLAANS